MRYLHRLLPPRRSLAVHAASNGLGDAAASGTSSLGADSASASSWAAPFSSLASGMTSFLAPRPMSFALSTPSSSSSPPPPPVDSPAAAPRAAKDARGKSLRAGFAALRRTEKDVVAERRLGEDVPTSSAGEEKRAGVGLGAGAAAGWSLRSVSGSWSRLGFGTGAASPPAVAKAQAEAAAQDDAVVAAQGARDEAALESQPAEGGAPRPPPLAPEPGTAGAGASEADEGRRSGPTTPLVELAPSVDVGELAEAMGASPAEERTEAAALDVGAAAHAGGTSEEGGEPTEREKTFELVCGGEEKGEDEVRFHLRRYEVRALSPPPLLLSSRELFLTSCSLPFAARRPHARPRHDAQDGHGRTRLARLPRRAPPRGRRVAARGRSATRTVRRALSFDPWPSELSLTQGDARTHRAYPQQHFVQRGLFVSAFSPSASSSTDATTGAAASGADATSSTDEELATTAALLDAYRSLRSCVHLFLAFLATSYHRSSMI